MPIDNNNYRSVLLNYPDEEALYIISQGTLAMVNFEDPDIKHIKWAVNILACAIRVNDSGQNPSVFDCALEILLSWIKEYPEMAEEILIYLSQIYINESFSKRLSYYENNIRDIFISSHYLDESAYKTLIYSLLCGSSLYPQLLSLAFDVLFSIKNEELDFLNSLNSMLLSLIQNSHIRVLIMDKYCEFYEKSGFYKSEIVFVEWLHRFIDVNFSDNDKHQGFYQVIESLRNTLDASVPVYPAWNTQSLKTHFSNWFSISVEMQHNKTTTLYNHPLFDILKYGDPDYDIELLAEDLLSRQLSTEEGEEDELYYSLPLYATDFLLRRRVFMKSLISELKELYIRCLKKNHPSVNQCFILLDAIDIPLPILPDTKTINFNLLYLERKDLTIFWSLVHPFLLSGSKQGITMLYAAILGGDFSHPEPILANVTDPLINLALFYISEGTDFFIINPDIADKIIRKAMTPVHYSILTNHQYIKNSSIKNEEFFLLTKNYSLSMSREGELFVRHPLGISSFTVYEHPPPPIIALDIDPPELDESAAEILESDFDQELLEADRAFFAADKFSDPPPNDVYVEGYAARSLLADCGVLADVRTGKVEGLDEMEIKETFEIAILQMNERLGSQMSPNVSELIEILNGAKQNPICKFNFVAPCIEKRTPKTGMMILINESGRPLNTKDTFLEWQCVIGIENAGDSYIAELVLDKSSISAPFPEHNSTRLILKDDFAKFVELVAILFFAASEGADAFFAPAERRKNAIFKTWSDSQPLSPTDMKNFSDILGK